VKLAITSVIATASTITAAIGHIRRCLRRRWRAGLGGAD